MGASDLGRWVPLSLDEVVATFAGAPFRWWVAGGHALELHLGRSWRAHDDIDVGISRRDAAGLRAHLDGWDVQVAAAGTLRAWAGEPLDEARHENNLWCRRDPTGPWELDVIVGEGDGDRWRYRRDPRVQLPWPDAVLTTDAGVRYLAPDVQLLFKSKGLRTKDDVDARQVIPQLEPGRRRRLAGWLPADHPWQAVLGSAGTDL